MVKVGSYIAFKDRYNMVECQGKVIADNGNNYTVHFSEDGEHVINLTVDYEDVIEEINQDGTPVIVEQPKAPKVIDTGRAKQLRKSIEAHLAKIKELESQLSGATLRQVVSIQKKINSECKVIQERQSILDAL